MPPNTDPEAAIWRWDWVQILNCQRGGHANFELPNQQIFGEKCYRWNIILSTRRSDNPMEGVLFESKTESVCLLAAGLCKF